ncbi:MAG: hypothetical protein IJ415_03675 [Clostridia bacterium]|nr:hypothetical protein [Clostridia bacterium]
MKKFLGAICSGATAVLMFIFLSIPCFVEKTTMTLGGLETSEKASVTGWELLKDLSSDVNGAVLYKIFAIAMIVIASLLILTAIILILQQVKVLKSKFGFDFVNKLLLTAFVLCAIMVTIAIFIIAGDASGEVLNVTVKCYAGVGIWLNLAVGIVACIIAWLLKNKKRAK